MSRRLDGLPDRPATWWQRLAVVLLQAALHALLAVPPLWSGVERLLVALRHRYPRSPWLAELAAQWFAALRRWRPRDLSRVATLPGGCRLVIAVTDGWHRGIYFRGEYEPETTAFFRRFLRPGDTVLDVGANIGYYSCLAAAAGATVHAFEPNPDLADRLERSRDLNGFGDRLVVNRLAAAGSAGSAEFHLTPQPNNTGISSLLPLPHLKGGDTLTVRTVTLDGYCEEHAVTCIRLLKIDVEGAELQVLAGAGRLLAEARPDAIICEVGGFAEGSRPAQVLQRLAAAGYRPHEMTTRGLVPLPIALVDADAPDWPQRNVCFLRDGVREPAADPGATVPPRQARLDGGGRRGTDADGGRRSHLPDAISDRERGG